MSLLRSLVHGSLFAAGFSSLSASFPTTDFSPLQSRAIDNGIALRILPLGDSITWGYLSSDGNGYRLDLQDMLAGNPLQYVGSQQSGSMADNFNEGHPGAVISQIATYAEASLPDRPNVVLLMAGTNDCNQPDDPANAPARLGSLIDEIIAACPDAAVIVAKLTPIASASSETNVVAFNAAVPGIVATRAAAGHKVLTVDMSSCVSVGDLADGLHPNDGGYNLMAKCWYGGIQQAASNNWISKPVETSVDKGFTPDGACTANLYWDPVYGTTASGVGHGDAPFAAGWNHVGKLAGGYVGTGSKQGAGVRLADIDGDGKDDYLWVDPVTGAVTADLNGGIQGSGGIDWLPKGVIASGIGDGPGVMFADINGDGLADYLWVDKNGDVTAYKNGGPKAAGGWIWYPLGVIATGLGGTRATTRFADIDGDGRAEYLIVGPTGSLNAWLNSGFGDKPIWESMGEIATGVGDTVGVYLQDLNGDGRADYIWLNSVGAATVYINYRGHAAGLAPNWVSYGVVATGVGTSRDNITFGDMNGDGLKDYVFVHADTGELDVWQNQGTGGKYVTGDGTRFADMNGDGKDDYLFMDVNGAITLYVNDGYDSSAKKWIWVPQGVIASGVGATRKDIRMGDLDGDGLADYLVVDEKSGAVTFWRNGGPNSGAPGGWLWYNLGQVASGIGAGRGVQFADINGDGKVDYLWVDTNGAVTAYLNGGNGANGWIWYPQGVIATGVGASREDVQFHDLNGDGKADYLWVDRLIGSLQVWRNGGSGTNGWIWYPQGEVASGVGANGLCIQFADTTGDGRADYLDIDPTLGAVSEWFNGCSGATGSDNATDHGINPPAPNWQTAQCTEPAITNAALDQTVRWNSVDTDDAWTAAVASWTANPSPGGLSFPEQISNFFHGPEQLQCGQTDDHNGCDTPLECSDTNHPAGYFILNSFVAINNVNLNFYDAVGRVEGAITAAMGTFATTFAPIQDESEAEKIILDLIGLGFALVASPIWNSALKGFAFFRANPNTLGTLKDDVNPLVSNGVTLSKDTSTAGDTINTQNILESAAGILIQVWYNAIAILNKNLFDGSTGSISQLQSMMTGGKLLEPGNTVDDPTIQNSIEQALYGYLIPQAWSLSNEGITPFILDSGFDCSAVNPLPKYMSDSTGDSSYTCYENKLYYLLSATGNAQNCDIVPCGISTCTDNDFSLPPGITALDGKAYGGVTRDMFTIGAVASYRANNNANGWPAADPSSSATISALYDTGIETVGVVQIPVCTAETAFANWLEASSQKSSANYPCGPPPTKRSVDEIKESLAEKRRLEARC